MTGVDADILAGPAGPAVPTGPPQRVAARGWGSHRTIASAIRAAARGGLVTISPGVYRESLVLDQDVTIIADTEGGAVEIAGHDGPALLVRASTATVRGLTIRGSQPREPAVAISGGSLTLQDCVVSSGRLVVTGWAGAQIAGCHIHHGGGPAVEASGDCRIRLSGCVIEDVEGAGVALGQSSSAEVIGGAIQRVTESGVHLAGAAAATIVQCEVAETGGAGVLVEGSAALLLRASRLRDLTGDGIRVRRRNRPARRTGRSPDVRRGRSRRLHDRPRRRQRAIHRGRRARRGAPVPATRPRQRWRAQQR